MNTKQVQEHLIELGFGERLRPFGADGKIGKKTRDAVKTFQAVYNKTFRKNIYVDGIPGKQTYDALRYWKRMAGQVGTNHFNIQEFRCKGSKTMLKNGMDNDLLTKLEQLRYRLGGKAILINSGYRSPAHNKRVGGASQSQHLYGKAVDIVVRGVKPSVVYREADKLFNGVWKYNTFTHVDTRSWKARF